MTTSRKIALLFGAENINAIIGWIALLFVARKMGAGALGEFSYAMSLVGGFTFIAFFGFRMAHVKRISEGLDLGKCIGTFFTIRVFLVSIMLLIFALFYWLWTAPEIMYGFPLGKEIYDTSETVILLVLIYYIIFLMNGVIKATFSGLEQSAKVAIPNVVGTTVRSILFIYIAFQVSSGELKAEQGVLGLAISQIIGILIIFMMSLWYFRGYPISKPDQETFQSYKIFAFPVAAASIFGVLKQYIDKILVGIFWTATDVGLYFAVQRIALFIGTMALAIEEMLLPSVSKLHSKSKGIQSSIYDTERYVAMVCIPIVAMTVVWSSEIIVVFISREFLPAVRILQFLALAALVKVVNRPWSVALRGSDRPDLTSIINIFSSSLNIFLMLILVPKQIPQLGLDGLPGMGGEGAALALLISEIVLGLSLRILCYSSLDLKPQFHFFLQLFFALIIGLIMWQVQGSIGVERWYELFFFSALGGFLYIFVLAAVGIFSRDDFIFFWNVMNPKAMTSYVGDELTGKK